MKITAITSYFPRSTHPYFGNSAFHTLRFLKRYAEIEVICPLPAYPNVRWLVPDNYERPDLSYRPPEFSATYFTYPALPVLSRPVNGPLCTHLLLPYVRASRPDLLLNYWLYPDGYAAVRAGRKLGIPVVVCGIGSDIRRRTDPFTIHFVRKTMTQADAVSTVSGELRKRAIAMGVPAAKITASLNGCDTSVFHPGARDDTRRQLDIAPEDDLVLYVGNLLETKGLGELITAFIGLLKDRPAARLAVIGKGPYGETLSRRAGAAGVQDRVLMLGHRDSAGVAQWMRAASLLCLPSYSEGCPNVVIEALACGLPVVATTVGGIPELVDHRCGILIPPERPEELRQALNTALSKHWDTCRIAQLSKRGWDDVAQETLAVCRKALGSAPSNDTTSSQL